MVSSFKYWHCRKKNNNNKTTNKTKKQTHTHNFILLRKSLLWFPVIIFIKMFCIEEMHLQSHKLRYYRYASNLKAACLWSTSLAVEYYVLSAWHHTPKQMLYVSCWLPTHCSQTCNLRAVHSGCTYSNYGYLHIYIHLNLKKTKKNCDVALASASCTK